MNIIALDAKTPRWGNEEHTSIILDVLFNHLESEGYVPFVATLTDIYQHTIDLYNKAIAGEFGPIAEFTPSVGLTPSTGQIPTTNTGG